MPELTPLTALGGKTARIETLKGVRLIERPDIALASVAWRRDGGEADAHLGRALDMDVPGPRAFVTAAMTVFWTARAQWMVEAPIETHEDLAADLKSRLGARASVVEQTDAWTCFDLSGANLVAVMELLTNLDIRRMAPGTAERTSIHHLGAFVLVRGDRISIYGPRSSAGSLHHAICTAIEAAL